jgi:hypothetical protein
MRGQVPIAHLSRKYPVAVSHQLEIRPVVARDVLDVVGELLPTGKQLFQVAEAARHGLAADIDDPGLRKSSRVSSASTPG